MELFFCMTKTVKLSLNCKTSLAHISTSVFSNSAEFWDSTNCVLKKRHYDSRTACILCKVAMMGFIFLPPVYWEWMAHLHVNSSRCPAASLKVANGATCKGSGGRSRRRRRETLFKKLEKCTPVFFSAEMRTGFINLEDPKRHRTN